MCVMCNGSGWVVEAKTNGGAPVALEIIPCLLPDCRYSGQEVGVVSLNHLGMSRAHVHPAEPLIMSITR